MRSQGPRGHRKKTRAVTLGQALCLAALLVAVPLAIYCGVRHFENRNAEPPIRGDLGARFTEAPVVRIADGDYRLRGGVTSILLMGVDTFAAQVASGFRNGGQSDFLLLMVIDERNKTVTPVQIDRDTMAEITILGVLGGNVGTRRLQICLSHGYGDGGAQSCEFTREAVSRFLLGVSIDFYLAFNLDGISALNDALGGIVVTLADDFTSLDPAMTKGTTLRLQGEQAEYFVRSRMNIGIGTNEARQLRQQQYLDALGVLVDKEIKADANYIGKLFDVLAPYMLTDMKRGRMINDAWAARDYTRNEMIRPAGSHAVGEDGFMEFHADAKKLEALVIDLFYERV